MDALKKEAASSAAGRRGGGVPPQDNEEVTIHSEAEKNKARGDLVYLDNAATSWPKPAGVCPAMTAFQQAVGASPGRSGHRLSVESGRVLFEARERAAALFNAGNPMRVVFASNATEALNVAMRGLLRPGDHAVTGGMEHNSVMRPLRDLERDGVEVTVVPCDGEGVLDPAHAAAAFRVNTRMVIINHASNVSGTVAPVGEIGRAARESGVLLLVDAAQTAGSYPIDVAADCIDLLAFTGHKSLMGPQGTGGLVIGERVPLHEFAPLKTGGTGSRSESEHHPDFLPDKFESGTPNTIGIAGLNEGMRFVLAEGINRVRSHEMRLAGILKGGLSEVPGLTVYGPPDTESTVATVSFTVSDVEPGELGYRLDEEHGVLCRVGLHCAPAAHRTLGTFPEGTVRLSIGYFNTEQDMERAIEAVKAVAKG